MKKTFLVSIICFMTFSCAELQNVINTLPTQGVLDPTTIASGLREALDLGIEKQVSKLTQKDGFYKNALVKILLPEELRKVDNTLRSIGLGKLADEGLKVLNRAAEDAVRTATPVFVNAVKNITFNDAKDILLSTNNAATNYLEGKTTSALYNQFNPVIKNSFSKVGADKVWSNIITRYNAIPLTNNVNPDLTDYVTSKALEGVYKMIALEETKIRTNLNARTSTLLRQVFALQDQ